MNKSFFYFIAFILLLIGNNEYSWGQSVPQGPSLIATNSDIRGDTPCDFSFTVGATYLPLAFRTISRQYCNNYLDVGNGERAVLDRVEPGFGNTRTEHYVLRRGPFGFNYEVTTLSIAISMAAGIQSVWATTVITK